MQKFHAKYFGALLFALALPAISNSQENPSVSVRHIIDSIKNALTITQADTSRVNTLNNLSYKLEAISSYDSSMMYAQMSELLAEKIGFKKGLARALLNIGNNYIDKGDYAKALENETKALEISREMNNQKGIAAASTNMGNIFLAEGNYSKALEFEMDALSIEKELEDKNGIALLLGNIGNTYSSEGNYAKGIEYDLNALTITEEIGDKIGSAANLGNIGNIYFYQTNYPKALEYQLKALTLNKELNDKDGIATNLGNIGNIYFDIKNLPEALDYYTKALAMSDELGDKEGTAINLDNIANIYYQQGNYEKSLEYQNKSLTLSKAIGFKTEVVGAFSRLGKIFIKRKGFKQAKMYLDSAFYISQSLGDKKRTEEIYDAFAKLDSATGNFKNAFEDFKTYTAYHDSLVNKENIEKTAQLEVGYVFEKREDSILAEQERTNILKAADSKRKSVITFSSCLIALLILISAILLINRQQIKRKKDKVLFEQSTALSEKEKNLLRLEKKRIEDELSNAQAMLNDFTHNMVEKNRLLEEFRLDLEKLTTLKAKEIDEARIENLEHLNKVTILTEDDWTRFKHLFEQVYKGFFIRLKEKLPDLTQAEIRLVCLTKLNLDTKEMAGILGVSLATIRQSRYRMRKKFGLSDEGGIDEIVNSI